MIRIYKEEEIMEEAVRCLNFYDKADGTSELLTSADLLAEAVENTLLMLAEIKPELSDKINSFIEQRNNKEN